MQHKKEEELLRKHDVADELRRQIAKQHKSYAKFRGTPNDNVNTDKRSKKQLKQSDDYLEGCDIDINKLRKSQ